MGQIMNLIAHSISSVLAWFNQLDNAIKFSGFLLSAFLLYTVVRILINPLIGQASSDLATRATNRDYRNAKRSMEIQKRLKAEKRK